MQGFDTLGGSGADAERVRVGLIGGFTLCCRGDPVSTPFSAQRLLALLADGASGTAAELADRAEASELDAWHILRHLAANGRATASGSGLARTFSS